MNQPSEQLTSEYNIVLDYDQPLSPKAMRETVMRWLGAECEYAEVAGRKALVYKSNGKSIILLCKAITYLGNPHPVFKKRIQIPADWVTYAAKVAAIGYDVRFIGVYHYKGFVIFADFAKDTYMGRRCNNSAAHVYINDLYQGATQGVFHKIDRNYNSIFVVSNSSFKAYLEGQKRENHLLDIFGEFNRDFDFGRWLNAIEVIREMHVNQWSQWRQGEWAGWYLEYKFSQFAMHPEVAPFVAYTGLSNKGKDKLEFDFDIFFPIDSFYGDLKASDIARKESPGNDRDTFIQCINRHGKFWYVIYEHETVRDADRQFEATLARNLYLKDIDNVSDEDFDPMSYCNRMKHSVKFVSMCIIELNRINYHAALSDFNQGHQPDGSKRKVKFMINKRDIDNFVIYRYRRDDAAI